ncbi:MAG: tetratricopeptide repeat protein [Phycisphaerales bacterium]|nr:tetratricopeptide repeat protein [Phycisphaerales bacterium]
MSTTSPAYQAAFRLYEQGQFAQAEVSLRSAIQRSPKDADLAALMGAVLRDLGQAERAIHFCQRAVTLDPSRSVYHTNLGETLLNFDLTGRAEHALREAIRVNPSEYAARNLLAMALIKRHATSEALALLERAIPLRPELSEALTNAALLLCDMARAGDALALLRARRAEAPDDAMIDRTIADVLNYADADRAESFDAHVRYARALDASTLADRAALGPPPPARDPEKVLNIAFLSPDFREHSVAFFIEGLFKHLDRSRARVIALDAGGSADRTTTRLRALCDEHHDAALLPDLELARLVRARKVDILIDLAGLTHKNRLRAMALRAAPLQCTYLGYPNTTGVSAIDSRLVDDVTDPAAQSESFCTERLVRLTSPAEMQPAGMHAYTPPSDLPPVSPLPDGPPVLGSFNMLSKVSPRTLDTWAAVLRRIEDATLVLKAKALADESVRAFITRQFHARGINPARLTLLGPTPTIAEHLAIYSRLWLALDTMPYNGVTTTCESLVMGVPVVTLPGTRHAERTAASILTSARHPEWIARSADEYADIAARLVADRQSLAHTRASLRDQVLASPLCDAAGHARRFESALRALWREACSTGST